MKYKLTFLYYYTDAETMCTTAAEGTSHTDAHLIMETVDEGCVVPVQNVGSTNVQSTTSSTTILVTHFYGAVI